jgi:hypothetical protein
MHTDKDGHRTLQRIQLHFDSSDEVHPFEWLNTGHESLADAVQDLQATDAVVDEQRIPASDADKARGFGLDDFLLSVATNMVATLLINLVAKIFSRQPRPGWVTFEADSASLQISARDNADNVRARVVVWVRQHIHPGQKVTIRLQ